MRWVKECEQVRFVQALMPGQAWTVSYGLEASGGSRWQGFEMTRSRRWAYSIYFYSVLLCGLCTLLLAAYQLFGDHVSYQWLILASLAVLAGHFTVSLPRVKSRISVADIFIFANIILFGPAVGSLTAALEGVLGSRALAGCAIFFLTSQPCPPPHILPE